MYIFLLKIYTYKYMLTYIYAYISCSLTFNELFVLSSLSYCCPTCPVGRAAQGNTAVFFSSSFLGNTYSWVEWGKLSIYHIKYMSPLPGPEWHTSSSSLASCSTLMAARCATASSLCSLPRGLSVQRVFIGDSLSQQPCWSVKQVHFTGIHGQSIQTPATVKSEEVPGCYE